jgi:hypothetical protein
MRASITILTALLACSCDGLPPLGMADDAGTDALPVGVVPCTEPIVLKRYPGPCNYELPTGIQCAITIYVDGAPLANSAYLINCSAAMATLPRESCPDVSELLACPNWH